MSYGANLPQELIIDILYRLPVKSLCRFKCVSKSWFNLISHPHFARTHLNQNNNSKRERVLLVSDDLYSVDYAEASNNDAVIATMLDLFSIEDINEFDIWGSCNGLLLVCDVYCNDLLLNPSTREIRMLHGSHFTHEIASAHTTKGLVYDSSADDYKIVAIDARNEYIDNDYDDYDEPFCTSIIVSVYSLKTDSWRRIQDVPHYHPFKEPSSLVLVNGSLHWFTFGSSGDLFVIAAFDVADEKFREMQTPISPDDDNYVLHELGVLGGCLCMLVSPNGKQTDVWVMKEYGVTGSWTKFTIYGANLTTMKPLSFLADEEILLEMNEKLVAFNAKEKTSRDIVVCGIPATFKECTAKVYVESLVSPYYNCGCGCWIKRNYEVSENLESYQLDRFLELMIEAYTVGKAKRYKLDSSSSSRSIVASNSTTDHFSLSNFLDCLKSIGLERPIYEKALEMFEDPYWRKKFISMVDKREKEDMVAQYLEATAELEAERRRAERAEQVRDEMREKLSQFKESMNKMKATMDSLLQNQMMSTQFMSTHCDAYRPPFDSPLQQQPAFGPFGSHQYPQPLFASQQQNSMSDPFGPYQPFHSQSPT